MICVDWKEFEVIKWVLARFGNDNDIYGKESGCVGKTRGRQRKKLKCDGPKYILRASRVLGDPSFAKALFHFER